MAAKKQAIALQRFAGHADIARGKADALARARESARLEEERSWKREADRVSSDARRSMAGGGRAGEKEAGETVRGCDAPHTHTVAALAPRPPDRLARGSSYTSRATPTDADLCCANGRDRAADAAFGVLDRLCPALRRPF